ncbi:MAG TPA: YihY/virulence factor BrkB family protein [Micromonosporaceae bacterium]
MGRSSWWGVLKRTAREFQEDNLRDWAAALTYYGVLSLFPGLLVLVSALGLFGESATDPLLESLSQFTPGPVKDLLTQAVQGLQRSQGSAGVLAIAGLLGALWSASGYVAAFMRASNAIYDVPEGRPIWKTVPIRIAVTVVTGLMVVVAMIAVVLTGPLAERVGALIGLEETTVLVWNIAKWPALVVLVALIFALLYWASPNARQSGIRWVSPGGLLAVVLWILASLGFSVYVANFGSYNKTYGVLGAAIVFLIWLWISNIAILLGAEFDAELERGRAIAGGHPPEEEPFMELRDTRKLKKNESDREPR